MKSGIARLPSLRSLRCAMETLNGHLATLYRLCERTGLDLPTPRSGIVRLAVNDTMRIGAADRVEYLEVLRGTVWLTGTPATGDVLLREGEGFALADDWPFIVQAMSPAEIVMLTRRPVAMGSRSK